MIAILVGTWLLCGSPVAAQPASTATAHPTYTAYRLKHQRAAKLEPVLRELLGSWHASTQIIVDPKTNQILLHAPAEAHRVAARLIRDVDCRPVIAGPQQSGGDGKNSDDDRILRDCVLQTYRITDGSPTIILNRLRQQFANDPSIRIAADEASMQLFVLAPAEVHAEFHRQTGLEAIASPPLDGQTPQSPHRIDRWAMAENARSGVVPSPRPAPNQSQLVALVHSGAVRVAEKLHALVGDQLRALSQPDDASTLVYTWQTGTGDRLTILFDPNSETATITGPIERAQQIVRLLKVLDRDQLTGGTTRVMRVRRDVPALLDVPGKDRLRETSNTERLQDASRTEPFRATSRVGRGGTHVERGGMAPHEILPILFSPPETEAPVRPAAFQDGDADGARPELASEAGEPVGRVATIEEAENVDAQSRLIRQLGLDVEIEVLTDLDVIILRGRDQDVDRVAEIIREIERVAKEAKPQIEIVHLKHVRCGALADLIGDVEQALLQGRQGRVTVLSLETPNALLVIGWGEAIETVLGLIDKLDEPVAPSAEMRIFRLRHATATQAEQLVSQFLSDQEGLGSEVRVVADPRSNTLVVHAAPRDLAAVTLLIQELDVAEAASVEQVRIFELSHALAADLATTIQEAIASVRSGTAGKSSALELLTIDAEQERIVRSGLLDNVRITPNTQTNTLLITGPASSMDLIAALVEQLDAPMSTAQIKVFRIVNGDANSLVMMLRSLLPSQTGGGTRPQLAGAEGESSLAPLRFSVERRTNSIIATGSVGDLQIIEALLLRLDENDMQRRTNTVYRLKNAPAPDVARVINEFLRSERQIMDLAPGEISPFQQIESEVIVVPDPVSNTLLISATPRFYRDIVDLVEQLDSQPPQVMIQVLIAEVGLGDFDEFGVELGLQDSILFDRSMLGELLTTTNSVSGSTPSGIITDTNEIIQAAENMPGFLFNSTNPLGNSGSNRALASSNQVGAQGLSNFSVGRFNQDLGFGGLVLSAGSESVSVLIRALQETRHLEILSRPQVMTLDNQPAFIQVGQRVPRVTATQLSQFGQINSVELEDVGLILGVTPRINSDGMVVMEIDAEKSEVGPEAEGIPVAVNEEGLIVRSPKINIAVASTTVSAASGETIVLGGLIMKRTKDVTRRVPLLADVPLLGDLFRYDLAETQRAELLIILTPQVVLGPADKERIMQIEGARMGWCAADVHAIHGSGGLCHNPDCPMCRTQVPVIFPDLNPRGTFDPNMPGAVNEKSVPRQELPTEALPTPATIPNGIIQPGANAPGGLQPSLHMQDREQQPVYPAGFDSSPAVLPAWPEIPQRLPATNGGETSPVREPLSPSTKGKTQRNWSWPKWLGGGR